MARPVTTLVFFFLAFNLLGALYMSSGAAAAWGIDTNVGGGEQVNQTTDYANDSVDTGSSTGDTLFGMYNVLAGGVSTIFSVVTAGHTMLAQAGVPGRITTFLNTLFGVAIVIDIISFARGWGL